MYVNPRRINRNAQLGQIEAMQAFSAMTRKCIEKGDDIGAQLYATKAWHAMKLAGTEAVKAAGKRNY